MRVVIFPGDHRRAHDRAAKDFRLLRYRHGREIPAEGPADDADPFKIHGWLVFPEFLQARDLIGERHVDEIPANRALPIAAMTRRAASIQRNNDVTAV